MQSSEGTVGMGAASVQGDDGLQETLRLAVQCREAPGPQGGVA